MVIFISGGDVLGPKGEDTQRPLGVSGGTQLSGMTLEDWRDLKLSICGILDECCLHTSTVLLHTRVLTSTLISNPLSVHHLLIVF